MGRWILTILTPNSPAMLRRILPKQASMELFRRCCEKKRNSTGSISTTAPTYCPAYSIKLSLMPVNGISPLISSCLEFSSFPEDFFFFFSADRWALAFQTSSCSSFVDFLSFRILFSAFMISLSLFFSSFGSSSTSSSAPSSS